MSMPQLSSQLLSLDGYATKAMAEKARAIPGAINLAFGEPAFGPPETSRYTIENDELTWDVFHESSKRYEKNRGLPELRVAIADYYARRYGLHVDPETEILITHGGVEAINLAALVVSDPADKILITDPTYMLYQRAIRTLGREPVCVSRAIEEHEYETLEGAAVTDGNTRALIVNSPENPSGYVASRNDFEALRCFSEKRDLWIIHDEVYDSMAFARPHIPARSIKGLRDRSILINSFSKKYGVPGLRIGWMCAPKAVIDLAAKLHDFMYLGVNILSERIALRMISDTEADSWMDETARMLGKRADRLRDVLGDGSGFSWPRQPQGGMFAFPDASGLVTEKQLLNADGEAGGNGALAADWLLKNKKLVSIPGHVYGPASDDCIRLILCSEETVFEQGLEALSSL